MAREAWGRCTRSVVTTAALGLAVFWPASAQEDPVRDRTFVESVDVRVVEVEVVVTDRKGNPVLGLGRDDFQIFEDGEPVEVTNFYAVEAGRRLPDPELADDPEAVIPPAAKSNLVVVVDSANLVPTTRTRILRRVEEQLDRLATVSSGVMVVNLEQTMRIENRFTQDGVLLRESLERIMKSARGMAATTERNIIMRRIENAVDPRSAQGADPITAEQILDNAESDGVATLNDIRSYIAQKRHAIENGQRRLKTLVESLAGLEGRKIVLYVSSGYEPRLGEALYRRWWDKFEPIIDRIGIYNIEAEISQNDISHEIHDLVAHAAANSAVFYALGTGLDGLGAMSAEISSVDTAISLREQLGDEAGVLEELAFGTGGLSLTTSNNVDSLIDRMTRGLESYYSLGYSSLQEGSGRRRNIRVEVGDAELIVRYARAYLDKTDDELMKERTLAALLLDVAENPLAISVQLGEEKKYKNGKFLLPLQVKIPISNLTLLPESEHHVARLSLVFVAQDDRGTSDPVLLSLPIEIPNAQLLTALSQSVSYSAELAVRSGEQKLAIGVRDEIAELDSTLNVVANVGRSEDATQ